MKKNIQLLGFMETTPEILNIVNIVDKGITTYLNNVNKLEVGEYESVVKIN